MNDLDLLRDLLKDEVLAPTEDTQTNKKALVLPEPDGQSYKLRIIGAPYDTIAFKVDAFPPCYVFRGNRGERKRADYVIVANDDDQYWIVYVEMKSGGDGLAAEYDCAVAGRPLSCCLLSRYRPRVLGRG